MAGVPMSLGMSLAVVSEATVDEVATAPKKGATGRLVAKLLVNPDVEALDPGSCLQRFNTMWCNKHERVDRISGARVCAKLDG